MQRVVPVVIVIVLLFVGVRHAHAQDGLDPWDEPNYGELDLRAGFTPDPYSLEMLSGGSQSVWDYFSSSDCAGYVTSSPDLRLNWIGSSSNLSIFFIGDGDSTMVVQTPSGDWICSDDSYNTVHPTALFSPASSGSYNIWVGSYNEGDYLSGTLYITELGHNPGNLDISSSSSGSITVEGQNSSGSITVEDPGSCRNLDDCDEDGISNSRELWIAETFMPVFEFDEGEHNILRGTSGIQQQDDVVFLYQVSEVKCGVHAISGIGTRFILEPLDTDMSLPSWIEDSTSYLLTVVAAYEYDYLPYDPGPGEEDVFNHYGDTERVRICIVHEDDQFIVRSVYINRHHELALYVRSDLEWDGSHVYLYVSEGKHATFASESECRGSVSASDTLDYITDPGNFVGLSVYHLESWKGFFESLSWVGFREDCGGGRVIRPVVYEDYNVGEYIWLAETTMGDMAPELPDNEMVWSYYAEANWAREHYFCGGYDVGDYDSTHQVVIGYRSPLCAGSLVTKWWPPTDQR